MFSSALWLFGHAAKSLLSSQGHKILCYKQASHRAQMKFSGVHRLRWLVLLLVIPACDAALLPSDDSQSKSTKHASLRMGTPDAEPGALQCGCSRGQVLPPPYPLARSNNTTADRGGSTTSQMLLASTIFESFRGVYYIWLCTGFWVAQNGKFLRRGASTLSLFVHHFLPLLPRLRIWLCQLRLAVPPRGGSELQPQLLCCGHRGAPTKTFVL
jgi:hypothetical protein